MSIIRRRHTGAFATIPNAVANDEHLSFTERGLLVYLLAKPEGWSIRIADLQKQGKCGRDMAYKLLNGLIERGYVKRRRIVDPDTKRVLGVEYQVFDAVSEPLPETPDVDPLPEKPDTALPDTANQDAYIKQNTTKTESLSSAGARAHEPQGRVLVGQESPHTELEVVLDEEHAAAVVAHFAGLGKPLSMYGARLKAEQLGQADDPNAAAELMISKGWSNFQADWSAKSQQPAPPVLQDMPTPQTTVVELSVALDADLIRACDQELGRYRPLPASGTRRYSAGIVQKARATLARQAGAAGGRS